MTGWFLEITCAALTAVCLLDPNPNPPIDRFYQTRRECYDAALEADRRWNINKDDWRLRCLPLKQ